MDQDSSDIAVEQCDIAVKEADRYQVGLNKAQQRTAILARALRIETGKLLPTMGPKRRAHVVDVMRCRAR